MSVAEEDARPSWRATLAGLAGFLAAAAGGTGVTRFLLSGTWGGTTHDPLWMGPVSGAAGFVFAVVASAGWIAVADAARVGRDHGGTVADEDLDRIGAQPAANILRYSTLELAQDPDLMWRLPPKPLKVRTRGGWFGYGIRKVWPVHQRGGFSVYEVLPGRFEVTRNGQAWGQPFTSSDRELAEQVCDRWAEAFQGESATS